MEAAKKKRRRAKVDKSLCVGCGCCEKVCPLKAIEVFKGLYARVDEARCVGCAKCAAECPASIIAIEEAMG